MRFLHMYIEKWLRNCHVLSFILQTLCFILNLVSVSIVSFRSRHWLLRRNWCTVTFSIPHGKRWRHFGSRFAGNEAPLIFSFKFIAFIRDCIPSRRASKQRNSRLFFCQLPFMANYKEHSFCDRKFKKAILSGIRIIQMNSKNDC